MLDNPGDSLFDPSNLLTTNILDLYALKNIGQLLNEINQNLRMYEIANATRKIPYIVELLNNIYIKFNRHALKGKNPNWKSSLSTLKLILKSLMLNIVPIMPFFAEYMFEKLCVGSPIESIHLIMLDDPEYQLPVLSTPDDALADEMKHIINIIKQVLIIRSKNNISMKMPIGNLIIKTSLECIKTHMNFLLDELNILDIQVELFDWTDIQIELRPNFPVIKQTYDDMQLIRSIINIVGRDRTLSSYLVQGKTISLDGIVIQPEMVEIVIKPQPIVDYVSQYSFIDNHNYCVYASTTQTTEIKILAYAKIIATLFQRMRKNAGLHPWDPIKLGLFGQTEFEFEKIKDQITTTCSIMPVKLEIVPMQTIYKYEFAEYTEDPTNDLVLYLY